MLDADVLTRTACKSERPAGSRTIASNGGRAARRHVSSVNPQENRQRLTPSHGSESTSDASAPSSRR